jgi:hypothetical protein
MMTDIRMLTGARTLAVLSLLAGAADANAALVTLHFNGTTNQMGSIVAGTPFTGVFSYDSSVAGVTSPYYGGSQNLFANAYRQLSVTIGGRTVSASAPGTIALYNNVSPPRSIPAGDSLYSFNPLGGGPSHSSGSFAGMSPNFIYIAFVNYNGGAFGGNTLPSSLNASSFDSAFVGFNYGPFGAGNTTTIADIASSAALAVPEPEEWAMMLAGSGLVGWQVRRKRARMP